MTMRHIRPRSVEWYEAMLDDENQPLTTGEVVALRTMKALEDASIRALSARVPRG